MSTVIDLMSASDKLKIFSDALKSSKMLKLLESNGPFTVFAPTDPAIAQAPASRFKAMKYDSVQFSTLVKYHVVSGRYDYRTILDMLKNDSHLELETLSGQTIMVRISGFFRSHIRINNATIVASDLLADNGVIHTIDTVLFPPK